MGRRRKLGEDELVVRLNAIRDDPERYRAMMQQMIWGQLDPATAAQYRRDVEYLSLAASRSGFVLTSAAFISATTLALIEAEASPEVVGRVRSAWRFAMVAADVSFDDNEYSRSGSALAGWRRMYKRRVIPRGACSFRQVEQLMRGAAEVGLHPCGFLVAYLAILRPGQLETIRVGDVRFRPGRCPTIVLHTHLKKRGRNGEKLRQEGQPRPVPVGEDLLLALVAGRHPDELLFPGWCSTTASEYVRTTATALGWSTSLKWDGLHCLRHGGKLDRELEDQIKQVEELQSGGWSSPAMAKWYSRVR